MLGKTNATTSSGGGGGGSNKTYGVKLAYEYMQDLLDNSVMKADAVCLDVLDRGGNPARLSGSWTYKPADFSELNALIAECEKLNEEDYTSESWNAFSEVLTVAIGVQVNP